MMNSLFGGVRPRHRWEKARPARAVKTRGTVVRRVLAATLAAGVLVGGFTNSSALAAIGGGGSGSQTGGDGTRPEYQFSFDDPYGTGAGQYVPPQGVGQASIDAMMAAASTIVSNPVHELNGSTTWGQKMQLACSDALANADARALAIDPTYPGGQSRVVWMFWVASAAPSNTPWQDRSLVIPEVTDWFAGGRMGTSIEGYDEPSAVGSSTSFGQALLGEALVQVDRVDPVGNAGGVSVLCLAANPFEPPAPGYNLTISTDKGAVHSAAGATTAVNDVIHADNGGSEIVETLTATVVLNFDGNTEVPAGSVSKTVTITNQGDTTSPDFLPTDFGWESWTHGVFWFDVQIERQGSMLAAVNTTDRDSRETWWVPAPDKQVVGSGEEPGDHMYEDIDGMVVFPGQKVEYSVQLDANIPAGMVVTSFGGRDVYDPMLIPDKTSVEVFDMRTARPVPASAYVLTWDDQAHMFTLEFTSEWVAVNVDSTNPGWLLLRFTGTVDPAVTGDYTLVNRAEQLVNNTWTPTVEPVVVVPKIDPSKDVVVSLGAGESLDGSEIPLNSYFLYKLTSSVLPANRAYYRTQWGFEDQFDRRYDQHTGYWALVTKTDLYDGETLVASAGSLVADSSGVGADLITVVWDDGTYTVKMDAIAGYLDPANSRFDLDQQWDFYIGFQRIAPVDDLPNTATELIDGRPHQTNMVRTYTPDKRAAVIAVQTGGATLTGTPGLPDWAPLVGLILTVIGAGGVVVASRRHSTVATT